MATTKQAMVYADEAMLLRWGDSSAQGRTVTFLLPDGGEHPFHGLSAGKNGQRLLLTATLIGADEKPEAVEDARHKTPAEKAIAKAHILADTESFLRWCEDGGAALMLTSGHAMAHIRHVCGVQSTTEFRSNPEALNKFNDLVWEYEHRGQIR